MSRLFRSGFLCVSAAVSIFAGPPALHAQHLTEHDRALRVSPFGINVLLGGVTGGLAHLIRGDPVLDGILSGAAGGAAVYAGKYVAARRTPGAGLVGRQIASVGSSIIGNTVLGHGIVDRVAFSIGPLRLYTGAAVENGHAWRVDVPAVVASAAGLLGSEYRLDLIETLSAGALVFVSDDIGGFSLPGTIFYSRSRDPEREAYVMAHERIHVLQYDQAFLSWSDPLERRLDSTGFIHRRFEFNLVGSTVGLAGLWIWPEHADRPWEMEAMRLGRR